MIVCSSKCDRPDERELLTRLPVTCKILLRGKGYPFDLLRAPNLTGGARCLLARWWHRWTVPVVAHHHRLDTGRLERTVIRWVDRVIVESEFAYRRLADRGVRTAHVRVVRPGIDDRFKPWPEPHEPVRILSLGLPREHLSHLVDLYRALDRPRAVLQIADAPMMLAGQSLPYLGYVPDADRPGWYQEADIFLCPAVPDGFGREVAEAMSTGVPVVCADGGALPELVRDTGIRCRTDEDYVRALRLLIDHPDARQLFGAAGRERIDRLYRWEQCVEGTMSVYREVAGCA